MIPPELRALLVCPVDHGDLVDDSESARLVCQTCGRRYPVVDGIPVMLADQAEAPK